MKYSKELIEKTVKSKGYTWFETGDFNLNIVGIRNSQPGGLVTNLFDDLITVSFKENGVWKYHEWSCTTDPGRKAVKNFSNPKGNCSKYKSWSGIYTRIFKLGKRIN